jgi:hypothetical protein
VTPTNPGQQRSAEAHSPSAPYASDDAFQGGAHGGAGWPGAEHDSGDAITGPLVSNVLCAVLGCSSANAVAPGEAGQDRVSNGQHAVEMAAALTFAKYLGAVAGVLGRGAGAEVGTITKGGAAQTFEILDGVRRAKAAELTGRQTIRAEVQVRGKVVETLEAPLSSLRSPFKDAIEISGSPRQLQRWQDVLDATKAGEALPPIAVQPGSQGPSIFDVFFR